VQESVQAQQARFQVTGMLQETLASLQALVASNTDAEMANFPIKDIDRRITPLLIATENYRIDVENGQRIAFGNSPRAPLNLIALHDDAAEEEEIAESPPMKSSRRVEEFVANAAPGRYRALFDNGQHTRAADILKHESGDVSVIILDSLRSATDKSDYKDYAEQINADFGGRTKCAFIPIDLQKSAFGCRIFAMSLALKMHSREDVFSGMHGFLSRARSDAVVALNPGALVDPGMMKHSQSRTSVNKYLSKNPDQRDVLVNKRGETLEGRARRHAVTRTIHKVGGGTKNITFNNSIELKRIAMVQRPELRLGRVA